MNEEIIIIAEHRDGKINPATFELVSFAERLRERCACTITITLIGNDIGKTAREIADITGLHVIGIENQNIAAYSAEVYVSILAGFLSARNARNICISHTSSGFEYAPALAVKLAASCITGIENIVSDNREIRFTRPAISGKIEMKISAVSPGAVLTIMPGAFKAPDFSDKSATGSYEIIQSHFSPQKTKMLKIIQAEKDDYPIAEAEVIVSAGRGIGKKENLEYIYKLAEIFERAAIGASRPVCDLGWLDYKHQVGTTGKTVAPKLYIACGISGTTQHVSGMKGSKLIIAVNTDPDAAIFNTADYCVVEDINKFIPVLIEEFNRRRSALRGD